MKIGVVCEGPTDFHAIERFFRHAFSTIGASVEFVPLQPQMDKTSPEGGWGNVLLWLKNNPPALRVQKYFGGGIFGGDLSSPPMNGLLIQLDSDVLGEQSFCTFVKKNYYHTVLTQRDPTCRANEIRAILSLAIEAAAMTENDVNRHVIVPAVESTEAWCVAAFSGQPENFETLTDQELTDRFMSALETTEGKLPTLPYAHLNKSIDRRKKLCAALENSSQRVVDNCASFRRARDHLRSVLNV